LRNKLILSNTGIHENQGLEGCHIAVRKLWQKWKGKEREVTGS
jgi:hypothetical protein